MYFVQTRPISSNHPKWFFSSISYHWSSPRYHILWIVQ